MLQRLAKVINQLGYCSRREAERLIASGVVNVNGKSISEVVTLISYDDIVQINGVILAKERKRLWKYYKPRGLINTHKDPENRRTIFDDINLKIPHIISVGRLDMDSEGLLLLTNDGALSRFFELPANKISRTYKVKAYGTYNKEDLKIIESGALVDGIKYGKCQIEWLKSNSRNHWFKITIFEGKNREVRKLFKHIGLEVNRLIRLSYGDYSIEDMTPGEIREVEFPNGIDIY